jgi:hypothetical protein
MPPPQIPACGFPAPGSCRRSDAIVGLDANDSQADSFSHMLSPALCPEHALLLAFPPTGRLPSTFSAADWCPTPRLFPRQLHLLDFLPRPAGQTRSPMFRRDPFERDVAYDRSRASTPRISVSHMLPSTVAIVSAPAMSVFRGSTPHPIRLLCTLRRSRRLPQRNTRYQAGATPYLRRTCTDWIAPASPGAPPMTLRRGVARRRGSVSGSDTPAAAQARWAPRRDHQPLPLVMGMRRQRRDQQRLV